MALSYEESAALMQNGVFIGRVKVGCITYARYISDEAPGTAGHSSRVRWAQSTLQSPDGSAQQITPSVVMDGAVQGAGVNTDGNSQVTDQALQGAVEGAVNKLI